MAEFKELVNKYKKRSKDQLVDTLSIGLSYAQSVSESLGDLTDSGLLHDLLESTGSALPFAVIAVTEEMKVILGKKDQKTMLKDTASRMVKAGASLTAGAAAAVVAGPLGAVGAALGTRTLLEKYRSRGLTRLRVQDRIERLQSLRKLNEKRLEQNHFSENEGLLYE